MVYYSKRRKNSTGIFSTTLEECKLELLSSDRIKHSMATESKRLDLIIDEYDKPQVITPDARHPPVYQPKEQQQIVNDYADLYKNFAEFNSKYNPNRIQEIRNIDPYFFQPHQRQEKDGHYYYDPQRYGYQPGHPKINKYDYEPPEAPTSTAYYSRRDQHKMNAEYQPDHDVYTKLHEFRNKPSKLENNLETKPSAPISNTQTTNPLPQVPEHGDSHIIQKFKYRNKGNFDTNEPPVPQAATYIAPQERHSGHSRVNFMQEDFEDYEEVSMRSNPTGYNPSRF